VALSYPVMAGLLGNSTGYNGDCTNVQELVGCSAGPWTTTALPVLASTGSFQLTIVRCNSAIRASPGPAQEGAHRASR
jgi:hypothetical protein